LRPFPWHAAHITASGFGSSHIFPFVPSILIQQLQLVTAIMRGVLSLTK